MNRLFPSSCNLRRFVAADRGMLITIVNTICAERHWMRTTRFQPTVAWEHALAEPDCPCHLLLVASDGERPVGWCRLFSTAVPGEAELGIGLLPPYRERGIGTAMIQRSLRWACERSLTRLTLTTHDDNHRAIHVFEKCGFSPTGRREGEWIEMELMLPNVEARSHCCE